MNTEPNHGPANEHAQLEERAMELLLERTLGNQSATAVAPRLSLIPKIGAAAASIALVALLVWHLVDQPTPSPEPHGPSSQQPGTSIADAVGSTPDKPEVKAWKNATDFREEIRRKTYLPASAEEAAQLLAQAESITIYNQLEQSVFSEHIDFSLGVLKVSDAEAVKALVDACVESLEVVEPPVGLMPATWFCFEVPGGGVIKMFCESNCHSITGINGTLKVSDALKRLTDAYRAKAKVRTRAAMGLVSNLEELKACLELYDNEVESLSWSVPSTDRDRNKDKFFMKKYEEMDKLLLGMRGLKRLSLDGRVHFSPGLWQAEIQRLEIRGNAPNVFAELSGMAPDAWRKHLAHVVCRSIPSMKEHDVAVLCALPNLRTLEMAYANGEAKTLDALSKGSQLRKLDIRGFKVNGDQTLNLDFSKLSALENLNLSGCDAITGEHLKQGCSLPKLRSLDISFCDGITAEDIAHLANAKNLRSLNTERLKSNPSDEHYAWLTKLTELESLTMGGHISKPSGTCFNGIEKLEKLTFLQCKFTKLTDEGLGFLGKSKSLKHIDITGCDLITDAGLRALANISTLEKLDIAYCSKLTKDGVAAFAFLKPDCVVKAPDFEQQKK